VYELLCTIGAPKTVLHHLRLGRQPWLPSGVPPRSSRLNTISIRPRADGHIGRCLPTSAGVRPQQPGEEADLPLPSITSTARSAPKQHAQDVQQHAQMIYSPCRIAEIRLSLQPDLMSHRPPLMIPAMAALPEPSPSVDNPAPRSQPTAAGISMAHPQKDTRLHLAFPTIWNKQQQLAMSRGEASPLSI
ncbi:hypothetical protein ACLOJK_027380, partial [Asimina triloba]